MPKSTQRLLFALFFVLLVAVLADCGAVADDDDDDSGGDGDEDDDDTADDDDIADDDTDDDDTDDDDTDDDDTDDDDTADDDDATDTTIYDIQTESFSYGTVVTINGVVATTGLTTAGDGFFVQEPLADSKEYDHAYNGLFIYLEYTEEKDLAVAPGHVFNITGKVSSSNKNTQLRVEAESDIQFVDTGAPVPPPYQNTTGFFGGWEASDPEPYEGVLVRVEDVQVDFSGGGGVYWVSQQAKLDEGQVRIDDWFYDLDGSVDDLYNFIQGPLVQFSDSGEHVNYRIMPRDADDQDKVGGDDDDDDDADGLFFSEYIEGSSYNKALEIYNASGTGQSLGSCQALIYYGGNQEPGSTISLNDVLLADEDVFVLCHTSAHADILEACDQTSGSLTFNGDDAVELYCGGTLDVIGQIGLDPGSYWGDGTCNTQNHTLVRNSGVSEGDANGGDVFDPNTEFACYAEDTFTYLGSHTGP